MIPIVHAHSAHAKPQHPPRPGHDIILTDDDLAEEAAGIIARAAVELRERTPNDILMARLDRDFARSRWVLIHGTIKADIAPIWQSIHPECRAIPCGGMVHLFDDDAGEIMVLVTLQGVDCESMSAEYCVEVDQ